MIRALNVLLMMATASACAPADDPVSSSDRQTYLDIVGAAAAPPSAKLKSCQQIRNADLRGDCGVAVLQDAKRHGEPLEEAWCSLLDGKVFRQECWFMRAEGLAERHQLDDAMQACRRAGSFEPDCTRHIWEDAVVQLASRYPPAGWTRTGQKLNDRIVALATSVSADEPLSLEIESRFFERALGHIGQPLNIDHCRKLPKPQAQTCRDAGVALYQRRLHRHLSQSSQAVCARDATTSGLVDLVPAASHPRLEAVLRDALSTVCADASAPSSAARRLAPSAREDLTGTEDSE